MKIFLLLTGGMGSGKGVASDFLSTYRGATSWSRTEKMKKLAHALIDGTGNPDDILTSIFPDPWTRQQVEKELLLYVNDYQPEEGKARRLYQDVTEICQEKDELCFERELAARIEKVGPQFCLIDDVRVKPAFDYFVSLGYDSARIEAEETTRKKRMLSRDGFLPAPETFLHRSETDLMDVPHRWHIDNNADSPVAMYQALDQAIYEITGRRPAAVDYEQIAVDANLLVRQSGV